MGKTRERICKEYICFGKCKLGRDASLYGICQTCKSYEPLAGAAPGRKDLRVKKREDGNRKILRQEGY